MIPLTKYDIYYTRMIELQNKSSRHLCHVLTQKVNNISMMRIAILFFVISMISTFILQVHYNIITIKYTTSNKFHVILWSYFCKLFSVNQ